MGANQAKSSRMDNRASAASTAAVATAERTAMGAAALPPPVFLHYHQEALDQQYDQRVWAPNQTEVMEGFERLSAQARAALPFLDQSVGRKPNERLDWFVCPGERRGVVIFVHGGAWRGGNRATYSYPAHAMHANGWDYVAIGFDQVPAVSPSQQAAQVTAAIHWAVDQRGKMGADGLPVVVAGHSSGAHLAALALTEPDIAELPAIRAGICVSGSYDLQAVRLSARNSYMKLTPIDVCRLSPLRHLDQLNVPIHIARAAGESAEFARQSDTFRDALLAVGKLGSDRIIPDSNHFEALNAFGEPDGWVAQVLRPLGATR